MILKDSSFQRFLFRQTDFNELHDDSKRQLIPKISRPSNTFSDKTTSYSDINEETSFSYSNGNTFAQSKEKKGYNIGHINVQGLCGDNLSRDARKPVFGVSDQVRHKPAYTSSEKS